SHLCSCLSVFFFILPLPRAPLFPYTTLFRSDISRRAEYGFRPIAPRPIRILGPILGRRPQTTRHQWPTAGRPPPRITAWHQTIPPRCRARPCNARTHRVRSGRRRPAGTRRRPTAVAGWRMPRPDTAQRSTARGVSSGITRIIVDDLNVPVQEPQFACLLFVYLVFDSVVVLVSVHHRCDSTVMSPVPRPITSP